MALRRSVHRDVVPVAAFAKNAAVACSPAFWANAATAVDREPKRPVGLAAKRKPHRPGRRVALRRRAVEPCAALYPGPAQSRSTAQPRDLRPLRRRRAGRASSSSQVTTAYTPPRRPLWRRPSNWRPAKRAPVRAATPAPDTRHRTMTIDVPAPRSRRPSRHGHWFDRRR
jgi:hypothetical protein